MDLALFDFDGTITQRELFVEFVASVMPPSRMRAGRLRVLPTWLGYKLGLVSGSTIRAQVARLGFRDLPQAQLEEAGRRFAEQVIPTALRPEAMARIAWHRERGDTVAVVSGAFDVYLRHWCQAQGLDWLCSSLEARDGVLTGRYHGAQCVGAEKPRRVRERYQLSRYAQIHAYGDTREDRELLALAHHRWYRWQPLA
ncbi:HAD family hydrolase [Lysobacter silvisoli]|uniref:HAD family hydrolase n=1 Tax=Lysobacter silvisoli TaxID=2293254 RepID=A0A371K1M5_9GAMM|nr:HAD family hydrolase [Lysobacter silvisoli]RDZ27788.1 HAD family hydrolase [Lysobacter silvisoli]